MSQGNPTFYEITRYAENYVMGGDQSKSWRKAFPKSKAIAKTIHESASTFHKLPKVRARIKELRKLLKIQSEKDFKLSANEIKKRLADAADMGIREKKDAQGNKVAESLPGTVSALTEINRMDGNHAVTRLALGGDPDAPPINTTSVLSEAQALALLKKNKIK